MRMSAAAVVGLLLCAAGGLPAEPFHPQRVSAEAKWLVHVDADAMRGSLVVDAGYQRYKEKCKAISRQIEELRTACRVFDPTKDLKAVTFYGTRFNADAGVAIVQATFSETVLKTLHEAVQRLPDYKSSRHRQYELHAWTHAKGTKHERNLIGVYVSPDLMLFGSSPDEVAAALDVLDGVRPSLGVSSPLAAATPVGALVVVRLAALSAVKLPIQSPILKRIEMLGLTCGESHREAYLTVHAETQDAKAAGEVQAAIDSALNAALLATEDYELSELINAVQVSRRGKAVTVDVRGPAQLGWFFLEKIAAKVVQARKARHEAGKRK